MSKKLKVDGDRGRDSYRLDAWLLSEDVIHDLVFNYFFENYMYHAVVKVAVSEVEEKTKIPKPLIIRVLKPYKDVGFISMRKIKGKNDVEIKFNIELWKIKEDFEESKRDDIKYGVKKYIEAW